MGVILNPNLVSVAILATADGVNHIVAAVEGKSIAVVGYNFTLTLAGTITFQDTAGTPIVLAKFNLLAGIPCVYVDPDVVAFVTAVGVGLDISNPAGVDTLGHLGYILI